ncbi:MAG TPA: LapA family protein, partial [Actinomycetota bacterium]|nr:LapA family protein [Actinomycetota bacterium]
PPESKAKSRGAKIVVAAILVVVVVVFVLRNSERVTLDFIVASGHPRMIWLIVGCVLIGVAVGYFLGRPSRPRSSPKGDNPLGPPGAPRPPKRK